MRHVVLNFHGLGEPQRPLEPDEDRYWVAADMLEESLNLADKLSDRVTLAITFDDGNKSDIEIGAETLTRHKKTGTFFVLASRIEQRGSLSRDDLRTLSNAGHTIGSHGAMHVDWRDLDPAGQRREWDEAREIIAEAAGGHIAEAAIPFGRYNGSVIRELRRRDYARIYTSDGGPYRPGQVVVSRTSPRVDMDMKDIEDIMLGRESVQLRLRRRLAQIVKRRL